MNHEKWQLIQIFIGAKHEILICYLLLNYKRITS